MLYPQKRVRKWKFSLPYLHREQFSLKYLLKVWTWSNEVNLCKTRKLRALTWSTSRPLRKSSQNPNSNSRSFVESQRYLWLRVHRKTPLSLMKCPPSKRTSKATLELSSRMWLVRKQAFSMTNRARGRNQKIWIRTFHSLKLTKRSELSTYKPSKWTV